MDRSEIQLNAYAKINLSLEITGKREDGYHDIMSLMQDIDLYDVITIKNCAENGTKYNLPHCTIDGVVVYLCTDAKTIPADMSNLAFKGIKAVLDGYMGRKMAAEAGADAEQSGETDGMTSDESEGDFCINIPRELVVSIDKRLPVAAGIAGGSGNGAACMLGLNALMGYPFSLRELMELGVRVGADVPFSLMMNARRNAGMLAGMAGLEEASAAAWVSGIGDIVEPALPISRHVIMANPGISVSTKDAYTAIDSLKSYSGESSKKLFINDLESYTLAGYPEAAELKHLMEEEIEADTVLMSGSGPTMIAYYSEQDKACSDFSKLEKISKSHNGWRIWFTQTGCTL
jgi:4-diphosphocytidyl-2-C-methyl-D-erythritol kinase